LLEDRDSVWRLRNSGFKHLGHDIRVRLRDGGVAGMDNFGADLTFFPAYPK